MEKLVEIYSNHHNPCDNVHGTTQLLPEMVAKQHRTSAYLASNFSSSLDRKVAVRRMAVANHLTSANAQWQ